MQNRCYTTEARSFEKSLQSLGITYNQFKNLCKQYDELTIAAKAEVNDMLNDIEPVKFVQPRKSDITLFGEQSISHIVQVGKDYKVVRDCDGLVLAMSPHWGKYMGCDIRTMSTGEVDDKVTLVADTIRGPEAFFEFED